MSDRLRRGARTAALWDQLGAALAEKAGALGVATLDIIDVGGGSGVFAVPLAAAGHRVSVVDPSPNALAALDRRAAEAGVPGQVRAVQGEAAALVDLVGASSADAVLCHGVLELADDPATAMAGVSGVLRPGGIASVVAAQRAAAVVAKAIAGHLADARRILDDPDGRWGGTDPLPRRFDEAALVTLVTRSGLTVTDVYGTRVFADLVPGAVADDPADSAALAELEAAAVGHHDFRSLAAALHIVAVRS
ncbi:MAG TPA: methyltransferase domain-containing protein [Jiangellaceae bacterium]|nr:methyltransferase domain-containing protein [Jiangellaceae bacterium]